MEKEVREILFNIAKREAEGIVKEARSKAEEIMKEADREAEKMLEDERNKLKTQLEIERSKRIGVAERMAKEKVLIAEHKIVEEVVKETLEGLSKLRGNVNEYKRVLTHLIEEALVMQEGDIEIHVNPEDKILIEGVISDMGLKLKVVPDESVNLGIVLYDTSRGFVVYNTLEERLEKAKGLLLENLKEVLLKD